MTLSELIRELEYIQDSLPETLEDDPEVMLAEQPNWPFEYSIHNLFFDEENKVLYIVEGTQLGYLAASKHEVWSS